MTKINYSWGVVFLFAVCKAQFFYNDDDYQPAYQDPPPQGNAQQYNSPPPAPNYNPSQRKSSSENLHEPVNYQPAPPAPPAPAPTYEHRPSTSRVRRRGSERRERPPPPPRVYSPSVFENLSLGKPPAGVHIPQDSFLNILTNGGRAHRPRQSPSYEPSPPQPQENSYVQPPSAPARSPPPQQTSYVQPPPPQPRHHSPQQTSYVQPPPPQPRSPPAYVQNPPATPIESRSYSRGPAASPRAQRTQVSRPAAQSLSHIGGAQPVENPVQYQAPPAPVQYSPPRSSRRRSDVRPHQTTTSRSSWNSRDEQSWRPRKVFGPSAFENLELGMAPPGINVPHNSFLNILRDDKPSSRIRRDQDYELSLPPVSEEQYPPVQYSTESRPSTQEFSADYELPQENPVEQPAPRRVNRQHQRPKQQPEFVENIANHQTNEEQPRVIQQQKPVQSRRRVSVRRHRQYSGSVPDVEENKEEIYQPPKQFGPSVFQNFGLGEAPPGIHVPEDSFLNVLRGDKPATRSSQPPQNKRPQKSLPTAPEPEDVYDRQNRRPRVSQANQPAPQRQSLPAQEFHAANAQPSRENRRPVAHQPPQPAVVSRAVQPPRRQHQRSRPQTVSAPRPEPVYEAPNVVHNARSYALEDDDIPRYRSRDNNHRVPQQEQVPPRKRINTAPQYSPPPPPPQPVYEAPLTNYDDSSSFEPDDIPRSRAPVRNQRPVQTGQPVHRPREDSRSRRRPPPPQPQPTRKDEVPSTRQQDRFRSAKLSVKPLPDDVDGDQIPGEAGFDYPTFHVIPSTSFSCAQQPHNGYYADVETSCQVMHLCQAGGVQNSFLCPNGTIFSQEKFSCQWWYKVNCADAPRHYGINDKLYKVPSPPGRRNEEYEK